MTPTPLPTQIRRPWRATLRTAFAAVVAFAALVPALVQVLDLDASSNRYVVLGVGVAAGVTRVMALPAVEVFLSRFVPWLAADPVRPENDPEGAH